MFSGAWKDSQLDNVDIEIVDPNITFEGNCNYFIFNYII
jgi:hypothetical protein